LEVTPEAAGPVRQLLLGEPPIDTLSLEGGANLSGHQSPLQTAGAADPARHSEGSPGGGNNRGNGGGNRSFLDKIDDIVTRAADSMVEDEVNSTDVSVADSLAVEQDAVRMTVCHSLCT